MVRTTDWLIRRSEVTGRRTELRGLAVAVAVVVAVAVALAGCGTSTPPTPLTPTQVEARLRTVVPEFRLRQGADSRDVGIFPDLVFHARTTSEDGGPGINLVLVYPTPAAMQAVRGGFRSDGLTGPNKAVTWDGFTTSQWIGIENVIVEVTWPGGSFNPPPGAPTPRPLSSSDLGFADRVRAALTAP